MPTLERPATNADSLALDHMHSFIAVVETGSQVRAAKRLGAAPTTIGRHIDRVQEHFGGGLFEAGASGRLSTRGELVEQVVRLALAELARTRDRLAREQPVLRIGFIRVMRPLVEKALRSQAKANGVFDFDARLFELTSEKQARALSSHELDIAICYALPELSKRRGIETSLVSEQPLALVVPERAWVDGALSLEVLASLLYAHSPRRASRRLADTSERWLAEHRLVPARIVECAVATEIIAYAAAGYGYGFLPALWSTANHDGAVFTQVAGAGTAQIAAYSLEHVGPWAAWLRQALSAATRAALQDVR